VKIFAVINQKGGVGKTTTVANLGAAIASRGRKVCLLDLDPQAHLTLHFGIEPGEGQAGAYELLTRNETSFSECLCRAGERLDVAPSVIDLAAAEVELAGAVGREQILRDKLRAEAANTAHDLMLIDCPPSLGLLTLNALAAADEVLIPLQPHFLALQGLGKLLETVSLVQRRINPQLRVGGVILCMYETTTRLAGEVVADLEGFFEQSRGMDRPWADARIFATHIRRNVKLAECPSYGTTIFEYEPSSHGAADYASLADEFLAYLAGEPTSAELPTPPHPVEDAQPRQAPPVETAAEEHTDPAPPGDGPAEDPAPAPPTTLPPAEQDSPRL